MRRRALPALLSLSETVACVWGRNPRRAQALCREFGTGRGTADYSALLGCVDVVYVATPVAAHLPLAAEALRAGLPVLVEKPLGLPVLVEKPLGPPDGASGDFPVHGRRVGVAYYRRLAPALSWVRNLLADRAIAAISASYRADFDPAPDDPRAWRTDPAIAGGGVLADPGSHRLDIVLWLLGEPEEVSARLGSRFPRGAERAASVSLAWPSSGARANLDMKWAAGVPYDRMSVKFEGGYLELESLDSGKIHGTVDGVRITENMPPAQNPHEPLMRDFAQSVLDDTAPMCPVEDAMVVDRVLAAAYRSAALLDEPP